RQGYAVFVKLWSLTERKSARSCKAVFELLDEILLGLVDNRKDDWFPSPFGGAVFLDRFTQALNAAQTLICQMSKSRIKIAVAITCGRFERVENVNRWNATAAPLNLGARMTNLSEAQGKTLADKYVYELAEGPEKSRLFGEFRHGKVKRTKFDYREVLGEGFRQSDKLSEEWPESIDADTFPADVVAF